MKLRPRTCGYVFGEQGAAHVATVEDGAGSGADSHNRRCESEGRLAERVSNGPSPQKCSPQIPHFQNIQALEPRVAKLQTGTGLKFRPSVMWARASDLQTTTQICKGDMLVSLDGEFVGAGVTSEKLRGTLLGKAGTTVRLGLSRGGEGEFSWDVVLTRFVCVPPNVGHSMIGWSMEGSFLCITTHSV